MTAVKLTELITLLGDLALEKVGTVQLANALLNFLAGSISQSCSMSTDSIQRWGGGKAGIGRKTVGKASFWQDKSQGKGQLRTCSQACIQDRWGMVESCMCIKKTCMMTVSLPWVTGEQQNALLQLLPVRGDLSSIGPMISDPPLPVIGDRLAARELAGGTAEDSIIDNRRERKIVKPNMTGNVLQVKSRWEMSCLLTVTLHNSHSYDWFTSIRRDSITSTCLPPLNIIQIGASCWGVHSGGAGEAKETGCGNNGLYIRDHCSVSPWWPCRWGGTWVRVSATWTKAGIALSQFLQDVSQGSHCETWYTQSTVRCDMYLVRCLRLLDIDR